MTISKTNKKYQWVGVALALIVFLATFLRFWQLGRIPIAGYWDEVALLLDAKVVAATGTDIHGNPWWQTIYPSYGDYKLPGFIWLAAAFMTFLPATLTTLRGISATLGVSSVLLAATLAQSLFQVGSTKKDQRKLRARLSLFSALVLALSPAAILFSRTGFEGHVAQFLLGLSLLITWRGKNWQSAVLTAAFGALSTYTYFSVRFVFPPLFILATLLSKRGWTTALARTTLVQVVVGLVAFFLLLWPSTQSPLNAENTRLRLVTESVLNAHDYAQEQNVLRQRAGNTLADRIFFHRSYLLLRELGKNYADHLSLDFLFLTGDANLRHSTTLQGLFLLPLAPFLVWGILSGLRTESRPTLFLIAWWMLALLPASVPETTPHALRSLNSLLPVSILIAFGLMRAEQWLKQRGGRCRLWLSALFLGLLFLALLDFLHSYYHLYPQLSATDWQAGYRELVERTTAETKAGEKIFLIGVDQRWFIWHLAYGPFTESQIVALEKNNYRLQDLPNFHYQSSEEDGIKAAQSDSIIVVTPIDSSFRIPPERNLKRTELEPPVYDNLGLPRFRLSRIEREE